MRDIHPLARKAIAELVGTFAFFFIGMSAIVNVGPGGGPAGLLVIALAHGIMLGIMISALGAISGGHFNPAVSLGLFIGRRIDLATLGAYWLAQAVGGILAGVAVLIAFPQSLWGPVHAGAAALAPGVSVGTGIFIEAVLTFFLVLAVYGTAVDPRHPPIGGFGIGLTVFADILMGGPRTGAAMNPARALGSAVVSNFWDNHLVYWIGPLLGGAVAGYIYMLFFWPEREAGSLKWDLSFLRSSNAALQGASGPVSQDKAPPAPVTGSQPGGEGEQRR